MAYSEPQKSSNEENKTITAKYSIERICKLISRVLEKNDKISTNLTNDELIESYFSVAPHDWNNNHELIEIATEVYQRITSFIDMILKNLSNQSPANYSKKLKLSILRNDLKNGKWIEIVYYPFNNRLTALMWIEQIPDVIFQKDICSHEDLIFLFPLDLLKGLVYFENEFPYNHIYNDLHLQEEFFHQIEQKQAKKIRDRRRQMKRFKFF